MKVIIEENIIRIILETSLVQDKYFYIFETLVSWICISLFVNYFIFNKYGFIRKAKYIL